MRHRAGCEVCGDEASVTTAGMCLCAPCAGVPATATAGVFVDAFMKTIDPLGLRHHLPTLPTDTEDAANKLVKKPLGEITDTIKVVAIAGSVAVIAFVAYEIFKKPPRGVAA